MSIDPYWRYATRGGAYAIGGGSRKWKCNFCGYEKTDSVTRVKAHLRQILGEDVSLCQHVPIDVLESLEGWRRQCFDVDTGLADVEQAGTAHASGEASSNRVAPSKRSRVVPDADSVLTSSSVGEGPSARRTPLPNVKCLHVVFRVVFLDLPGLLFFSTYTLLVLFWAEIYHQARSLPTEGLRPIFLVLNGIVYLIQVCIWLAEWITMSEATTITARLFFAVISIIAALGFVTYGGRLFLVLRRFPIESKGRQKKLREITHVQKKGCLEVLMQDGRVVAYESRILQGPEKTMQVYEKELSAVIHALLSWKRYLLGVDFVVQTDHQTLRYLLAKAKLSEKHMRWPNILSMFHFQIVHVEGKNNVVADALSRKPQISAVSIPYHYELDDMREQYAIYEDFARIFEQLMDGQHHEHYLLKDGFMMMHGRLCVTRPLRHKVLEESHVPPYAGHRGIDATV
ncbi:hypothetical protein L7F22_056476 [Adiantum nelumboides]|nr:hypothetical protein [Adiantum nelumboides]